jgi:hypothetical protein
VANPVRAGSDASSGMYRCTKCGNEMQMGSKTHIPCPFCGNGEWETISGGDSFDDRTCGMPIQTPRQREVGRAYGHGRFVFARGRHLSVPTLQGVYFIATGIWPLLSRKSFERVTGPKMDFWLAQTVGVLVAAVGTAILMAERRQRITPEVELLAVSAAGGLGLTEAAFAARGRISKVYFIDALIEGALVAAWAHRASRPPS